MCAPTASKALGATAASGKSPPESDAVPLEEVERQHIAAVLKRTNWRVDGPSGAARLLDMNASTLRSRIRKLGIRRGGSPS